jgi:hypothetical protein
MVYADSGDLQTEVSDAMMARIASAWTGPGGATTVEAVEHVDQWTIQGEFQNFSPPRKYSWPDGEQVYLGEHRRSGAVHDHRLNARRFRPARKSTARKSGETTIIARM